MIPRCDLVEPDTANTNLHRCIEPPDHDGQHACACGHPWPRKEPDAHR